jgi:hypothetical protein
LLATVHVRLALSGHTLVHRTFPPSRVKRTSLRGFKRKADFKKCPSLKNQRDCAEYALPSKPFLPQLVF